MQLHIARGREAFNSRTRPLLEGRRALWAARRMTTSSCLHLRMIIRRQRTSRVGSADLRERWGACRPWGARSTRCPSGISRCGSKRFQARTLAIRNWKPGRQALASSASVRIPLTGQRGNMSLRRLLTILARPVTAMRSGRSSWTARVQFRMTWNLVTRSRCLLQRQARALGSALDLIRQARSLIRASGSTRAFGALWVLRQGLLRRSNPQCLFPSCHPCW